VSGNHAPSVTMTANPQSGTAPLRVRFEAQGSDPDGGSLRYRWDFGDGSRPETDRRETHTYRNPGTYTARVTVTDREGASSTAEMEITVTAQPVNQPPSVTMTATPQTGAAPLLVGFVAEGNDPEGGALSYRWSFGDDSDSESGREVTHRYRRRGTYTARVTVTDSEGERESAELRITVTRSGGS
jgi:cellulose 1,4-beta-cellobiosidase